MRETTEQLRQAQAQWQQQQAQYEARLQEYERQRNALLGIQPPPDPDAQAIKEQFSRLFPTLAKFEERGIDPEQINALLTQAQDMQMQQAHYWQSYGRQSMDRLFDKAQATLGAPLNDKAKEALHTAFMGYVGSSQEMLLRYANDPTLVDEFWNSFASSFIEPVRRVAATAVAERAAVPVPRDSGSTGVRVTPAPPLQNMDERAAAAWAQYQQIKKP